MWCNHPLNEQAIKREQYQDMARRAQQSALAQAYPPSHSLSDLIRRLLSGKSPHSVLRALIGSNERRPAKGASFFAKPSLRNPPNALS